MENTTRWKECLSNDNAGAFCWAQEELTSHVNQGWRNLLFHCFLAERKGWLLEKWLQEKKSGVVHDVEKMQQIAFG